VTAPTIVSRAERIDGLIDVIVNVYAPLPASTLVRLVSRLRYAVPQWSAALPAGLRRAKERLAHQRVGGVDWYWPAVEAPATEELESAVRLLSPFDPVVWDRQRFELFWGWAYRFEAYTPVAKRQFGYYALPLLWRDRVVGWGNVAVKDAALHVDIGFVGARPRDAAFAGALDEELDRMRRFLRVEPAG
jgi:uncharacterized protein YcaQ